ncbi:MAG: hypothetical protein IPN33_07030 [Saprospiraceae bacterium]|nr:hypothetical protein [Saprospiraceae bacterium]
MEEIEDTKHQGQKSKLDTGVIIGLIAIVINLITVSVYISRVGGENIRIA